MSLRGDPIRGRSDLRCDLLPLQAMSPKQRCARAAERRGHRGRVSVDQRIAVRVSNLRFRMQFLLPNLRFRTVRRIRCVQSRVRERRPLFLGSRRNIRRSRKCSPSDPPVRREQTLVVRNDRSTRSRRRQHAATSGQAPRPQVIRIGIPRFMDRRPGTPRLEGGPM